ncbi:GT2 family glycosyltransferase [Arthrobacter sp. CAN_A6]
MGVDAGSTDKSASTLRLHLPGDSLLVESAASGFGAAVQAGIRQIPERDNAREGTEIQDWLWLLHDDSAPEPTALEELLSAVERAPSVTVAGAKQVGWDDPRKLEDVGLSVSRWAERLTLIDGDELDQGQHDGRSDVFAVSSSGMLVLRSAWDELGGFDPALPDVGDDVDFCWRNRRAGHRVVVVPAAVVRHSGCRSDAAATLRAGRRAEVYLRLKHSVLWTVPFLAAGAVIGGVARLLVGLVTKDPGHGAGQLLASCAGVCKPLDLFRGRRSIARTKTAPRRVVHALRTPRREVRSHRRSVLEAFPAARALPGNAADQPGISSRDSHDFSAPGGSRRPWGGLGAGASFGVLLAASLVGLSGLIGAPGLSGGALLPLPQSPAELWDSASTWWVPLGAGFAGHGTPFSYVLWLLSILGFGNGNAAVAGLVLLAMPLAGLAAWFGAGALTRHRGLRMWAALSWGAVPALQVAIGSGRLGALVAHVLLPLVLTAMVRAVGVGSRPFTQAGATPTPGTSGVPSWTATGAAGLLLAAVTAAAPSLLVVALLGVIGAQLILRRRARILWWSVLPSLALFVPFAASASGTLRDAVAEPGIPLPFTAAELWQQLLGFPVAFDPLVQPEALEFLGPGFWALVPVLVIGAPPVVLAVFALFGSVRGRPGAYAAWALALLCLIVSAVYLSFPGTAGGTALIPPFSGPLVSGIALFLLAAALVGADGLLARRDADRSSGTPAPAVRALVLAVSVVLAAGPLTSLGLWILPQSAQVAGTAAVALTPSDAPDSATSSDTAARADEASGDSPGESTDFGTAVLVHPVAERILPATAADRGTGPDRTRTLVLTIDGSNGEGVAAMLMRGGGTTLDTMSPLNSPAGLSGDGAAPQFRPDDAADDALRGAVAMLVGGTGADPRAELRRFGVGHVVLQQSDTAAELLAEQLDAAPGLTAVGKTPSGWLWRVTPSILPNGTEDSGGQTARARIVDAEGRTEALVPSGTIRVATGVRDGGEGRTLVLAERADTGWQAALDGRPLESASEGWAQTFVLPPRGGHLTVDYVSAWQPWTEAVQMVVFGASILLAVPVPSRPRAVRVRPAGRGPTAASGREPATGHGPVGPGSSHPTEREPGMAAAGASS